MLVPHPHVPTRRVGIVLAPNGSDPALIRE